MLTRRDPESTPQAGHNHCVGPTLFRDLGERWSPETHEVPLKEDTYHSPFEHVYHIVNTCPVGRLIPAELRKEGMGIGDRPLCSACKCREESRREPPV